jgi:hypothetical protein
MQLNADGTPSLKRNRRCKSDDGEMMLVWDEPLGQLYSCRVCGRSKTNGELDVQGEGLYEF